MLSLKAIMRMVGGGCCSHAEQGVPEGVSGLAFDFVVALSSGVSCDLFAGLELSAVSAFTSVATAGVGLAFDFIAAWSSGVSFDLFTGPELSAVSALVSVAADDDAVL